MKIIKFVVSESNYLQLDHQIYKPEDGLAIGDRISSILMDWVMTDILNSVVEGLGYDPVLLLKYVDDFQLIGPNEKAMS